jgi:two-component system NtrC family sensor kinase
VSALADLGGLPLAGLVKRADGDPIEVVVPGSPEAVLVVRPSPVIDPDGTPSGAALLVNDETEARLREARLLQAEKLSSLGELLAGVAHELNTPLATILGYAEILSHKASDHQRSSLAAILEEAERCRRVVSTLLSFVRPRKAERLDLDVGAIAGSVLDIFAHDLSAVHIEVRRELAPLPPVRADRYELQQVFLNLIRNAREAILGTGRPGRIAVVASVKAGRARVEVRDSGPGFPKEAQGLLVPRPFFTTKESGTGLGLSIALGIVHDHGGEIHASEAPEGGASIAVELPLAVTEAPAVSSAVEAAVPPERAGRSRRVLIVDDEPHVRDLLAQICRELGHVPVLATDGLDALEVLAGDARIDAVLSDVRMPRMDGMAFYRELVARRHPLAARLVFLSGDLARAETTAFLEGTARPVLPKPFRLAQVCRALEDVLPTA